MMTRSPATVHMSLGETCNSSGWHKTYVEFQHIIFNKVEQNTSLRIFPKARHIPVRHVHCYAKNAGNKTRSSGKRAIDKPTPLQRLTCLRWAQTPRHLHVGVILDGSNETGVWSVSIFCGFHSESELFKLDLFFTIYYLI